MQNRAKASTKERRNSNYGPLPPPPINFAKSRTPSPTHRMLAKSPQLDGPSEGSGASKLNTVSAAAEAGAGGKRLSPASARSQLHSEDSDGDADVEGDKPKSGKDRKASKKHDQSQKDSLQVEGGLEKKRSLKRDKSERIRGRRASQSKDKDVDRVKMSAADPPASAKVSLPTTTLPSKGADELVAGVNKVNLSGETPDKQPDTPAAANKSFKTDTQTPVAQRVQSIPTIKDDLFSSPAEPKVGLPNNASTAKDDENASAAAPRTTRKRPLLSSRTRRRGQKSRFPPHPSQRNPNSTGPPTTMSSTTSCPISTIGGLHCPLPNHPPRRSAVLTQSRTHKLLKTGRLLPVRTRFGDEGLSYPPPPGVESRVRHPRKTATR